MKSAVMLALVLAAGLIAAGRFARADNPIIHDQFTADPTARVFGDKIYLYPSHDILPPAGRRGGFNMADYHVFSSVDLMDWQDHGVILSQDNVDWVDATSYSMWAPDCVTKGGKYYLFFPAIPKIGGERRIGVAVADKPTGPFKAEANFIQGVTGIDPCVLIDKDGKAYLFYALNKLYCAKLKENMTEIDGQPIVYDNLSTDRGLLEGPFAFERNGIYYLTYPHAKKTERLEYAISDKPMGPYKYTGVIMDESPSGCWTNHHSIVEYKNQWYLFYHDKDYSTRDTNRSVKIDYLSFNPDGTIQKVIPTHRGVGVTDAKSKIQIDRYSDIARTGATVSYLNPQKTFDGWKTTFTDQAAWIRYNDVNFDNGLKSVNLRVQSSTGGKIEIRLDKANSAPIATIQCAKSDDWATVNATLKDAAAGKHDIIVTLVEKGDVAIDWISFE